MSSCLPTHWEQLCSKAQKARQPLKVVGTASNHTLLFSFRDRHKRSFAWTLLLASSIIRLCFTLHLSPSSFICWFRRLDSYLWAWTSQFWMMFISYWNYRICFFLPFPNSSHLWSAAASTIWPFYVGGWVLCILGMSPAAEFYPQPEATFEYRI